MSTNDPLHKLISDLKERAKELNCIYEVQEILTKIDEPLDLICKGIIKAIPPGWQYPEICQACITIDDQVYQSEGFVETEWAQCAVIEMQESNVGKICVLYSEERPIIDEGPFLKEERKLIENIAEQFGLFLLHQKLRKVFEEQDFERKDTKREWEIVLDMLERTDPKLLVRISRKMINFLCWSGIKEAEDLFTPIYKENKKLLNNDNRPYQGKEKDNPLLTSYKIFKVAGKHLNEEAILSNIQKWIREDKTRFFVEILENTGSSVVEISNAIERFHHLSTQGLKLSDTRRTSFRVALIRRLLSDQPKFIEIAKKFISVDDFSELVHRIIYPVGSHGKIGGKSSGLFLANQILKKSDPDNELFQGIKIPKTWYLTSDGILNFMTYNNLEDVIEQKYKDIGQVRQEYSYVIDVFKNSRFAPEIVQGLSMALTDLGDVPLIVRSSSLLEDRLGAAFAGKYKSLFISNQGTKEERLVELMDAISEVYASTFGPDPIQYRTEHGLLDVHEEMGILIQEVVGKKVGDYFLPAFGGVAFSHNEYRWSSRIKREDGLVRIVPGLGTRAVDRLSNDYPILISPGQPNLKVNITLDETIRYSPKYIDVINLKEKQFETINIDSLLKENGQNYPAINQVVSILREDHLEQPRALGTDYSKENFVVTFEGLMSKTPFVKQIYEVLQRLQEKYNKPVDVEFAHDGDSLYLLQCRSQSFAHEGKPANIPDDITPENNIFTAKKYISNGVVDGITHIVYVNPQKYSELSNYNELLEVGKTVGKLNKILPKRQFILMGPGRWGSRGDIKLGVNVTYSEISNTAMLIEIAKKQKGYVPDVSFGTHFFQDLVEANIKYLPLYPDDNGIIFNDDFLDNSENILSKLFPDNIDQSGVIRVIDVPTSTDGKILQVLMNADINQTVAILAERTDEIEIQFDQRDAPYKKDKSEVHWRWRMRNVEGLASMIDPELHGVKGFYIFGSTKNATAGPNSDIDVLIHFVGNDSQKENLLTWLDGWSKSLSQMNYLRTGYQTDGLLDVHIITDEDIEKRTSYAIKIGAVTDAARPLPIGTAVKKD